jgi:hypothetical protein
MSFLRIMLVAMAALMAAGCASTKVTPINQLVTAPNEKLPAVSVFYKSPTKKLKDECATYDAASPLSHCRFNLLKKDDFEEKLRESKYFEQVHSHVKDIDYNILLTFANFNHEDSGELSNAFVSGATLMMVPLKTASRVKAEIVVLWREFPLKMYEYDVPMEIRHSILNPDAAADGIAALQTGLVARFLKDVERDQVFTGAFVNRRLQATDYEQELGYPKQIGDFQFQGQYIYPHPLAGIQLRFRHKLFDFDYIDAFVYPIRQVDWSNIRSALATEDENFRKEVDLGLREGMMKSIVLDKSEALSWESGHQIFNGIKISGKVLGNDEETYRTFMYLFTREDKFIKFRATFVQTENEPNIDDAVRQSLSQFVVPRESLFMAKLRQSQRETAIQQEKEGATAHP